MLKHQELKEYRDKQLAQKDKVEAEMLEEGDRLTEALIEKEKLEFEKEELEAKPKEERDEGRLLEIEDNLKDLDMAVTSVTATLDLLQEALEFVQSKLNQVTEELEAFDVDSISPLSFNALESIDSARAAAGWSTSSSRAWVSSAFASTGLPPLSASSTAPASATKWQWTTR